jgi:hypothetical protein
MDTHLFPASYFYEPGKQISECPHATVVFDDTREGWFAFRVFYHAFMATMQIPGSPHSFGMLCSILTPLQIVTLGEDEAGYSTFPIPVEGAGNAHKNAIAQGQYRAALCILLTKHFARLVSPTTYASFRTNPHVQIVTLDYVEMYRRLEAEYGELTGPEIDAKNTELNLAAPPGVDYRTIHAAHVTIHLDLAANRVVIADILKFESLCKACANLGPWATKAIEDFKTANPARADQTFERLNVALKLALRNRPASATTGVSYGAHHATATAAATPSTADLMAEIASLKKLFAASSAVKASSRPPRANAPAAGSAPIGPPPQDSNTPYCWFHGVSARGGTSGHSSQACNRHPRPPLFDPTATISARKGGSTRHVDLVQFP